MRTSIALVAVMVLPILLQLPELPEYLEEDEPTFPSNTKLPVGNT